MEGNDSQGGGQYDSDGGEGGKGNPQNSACEGCESTCGHTFMHISMNSSSSDSSYVEMVGPDGKNGAICLRCCQDPSDCPTDKDTTSKY